jgi:D-alanyl-D-alanine carboxypeptidase/D-alanyl-D-alanine-endopeptidase (penicillin-binding protein 4)
MPIEKDFDENPLRAYNVLPSAITIQSNTINFKLSTQKNKIKINTDPNLDNLLVKEDLRISNGKCGNWKSRLKIVANKKNNKNSVEFSGGFSRRCNEKEIDLAILDQSHYFFEIFKDLWSKNGGFFDGSYRKQYIEGTFKELLCTHFSRPLSELIRDVNKYSLNLMARNLMLTVIKEKNDVQPTEDMVNLYVHTWLKKLGLPYKGLYIDNGAGLSRNIQISINQLLLILQNIYNDPFMPEMIASFPIASIDGTLKNKMKTTSFSRNGHFKTGSLKNVVGIAGYFLNETKEMNSFVFIMNHEEAKNAQPFIEDLIDLTF